MGERGKEPTCARFVGAGRSESGTRERRRRDEADTHARNSSAPIRVLCRCIRNTPLRSRNGDRLLGQLALVRAPAHACTPALAHRKAASGGSSTGPPSARPGRTTFSMSTTLSTSPFSTSSSQTVRRSERHCAKAYRHPCSHCKTRKETDSEAEGDRHCDRVLPQVLPTKLVLRDRPLYRRRRMLLRRCKGRRVSRAHQDRRLRRPCRLRCSSLYHNKYARTNARS